MLDPRLRTAAGAVAASTFFLCCLVVGHGLEHTAEVTALSILSSLTAAKVLPVLDALGGASVAALFKLGRACSQDDVLAAVRRRAFIRALEDLRREYRATVHYRALPNEARAAAERTFRDLAASADAFCADDSGQLVQHLLLGNLDLIRGAVVPKVAGNSVHQLAILREAEDDLREHLRRGLADRWVRAFGQLLREEPSAVQAADRLVNEATTTGRRRAPLLPATISEHLEEVVGRMKEAGQRNLTFGFPQDAVLGEAKGARLAIQARPAATIDAPPREADASDDTPLALSLVPVRPGADSLFSPSISRRMKELNRTVEWLTRDQCRVLGQLQWFHRARIWGSAGSGKTLLATQKAIDLADASKVTLFLCHNRLLADRVSELTYDHAVEVAPFSDWVRRIAGEAPSPSGAFINYDEPDDDTLIRAFLTLSEAGPRYDAIIVDEGQDFRKSWWEVVDAALAAKDESYLYVFYDDNQALLPERSYDPIGQPPLNLSRNCRNAGAVYAVMSSVSRASTRGENDLREQGCAWAKVYSFGEESPAIDEAISWLHREVDGGPCTVLISDNLTFETSPFCLGDRIVRRGLIWQGAVRNWFGQALNVLDPVGLVVPPDEQVMAILSDLSREEYPTSRDIELVHQAARQFTVTRDVRRRAEVWARHHPLAWKVRNGNLVIWRSTPDPLWAAEIVMFFLGDDWPEGIPTPVTVGFCKHGDYLRPSVWPVLRIGDYKGLEDHAVLVFLRGPLKGDGVARSQLYVGVSRARLIVATLVDTDTLNDLPPRFVRHVHPASGRLSTTSGSMT